MISPTVREYFPMLKRLVNATRLIYFDSAATALKPWPVIQTLVQFYTFSDSNIRRSPHVTGAEATDAYERARETIARFIGASPKSLVFVYNTSDGLNKLADLLFRWKRKAKVLVTVMDHHSNMLPWYVRSSFSGFLKKRKNFYMVRLTRDGKIDISDYQEKLSKVDIVCFPMVSNVLGTVNDVKALGDMAKDKGKIVVVDGAQGVPHFPINVRFLPIDALAFSGHKMMGPYGSGGLYIAPDLMEELEPCFVGGDTIRHVNLVGDSIEIEWDEAPHKFEPGTPSVANQIALAVAAEFLSNFLEEVPSHEREILKPLFDLIEDKRIPYLGPPLEERGGLVSLAIPRAQRVAYTLAKFGIATRAGHHCAEPLHDYFKVRESLRFSLYLYNTKEEMEFAVDVLQRILSGELPLAKTVYYTPVSFMEMVSPPPENYCQECVFKEICDRDPWFWKFCPLIPPFLREKLQKAEYLKRSREGVSLYASGKTIWEKR